MELDLLSKAPAEEEDSVTCRTTIPSWRQCPEIKRQECKLCVLSNLTKYQIFVCRTFCHFNSSAVLSPLENLLSFEFVYWIPMCNGRGIPFVTALCASTLIEISMRGRGGMEHKRKTWALNRLLWHKWHFACSPFHCLRLVLFVSCRLKEGLTFVGGNMTTRQRIYSGTIWCWAQTPLCKEREINLRPDSSSFSPCFVRGLHIFLRLKRWSSPPTTTTAAICVIPLRLGPWHQRLDNSVEAACFFGKNS